MNMTVATPPQPQPMPTTPRMTAEEFGLKHAGERVEYVNGIVKEVPLSGGGKHGNECSRVAYYLTQQADDLGHIFSNDTFVRVPTKNDPDRIYGPDVCFVSFDRLPKEADISASTITIIPNLVVEVRSPFDTWTSVFSKIVDYLNAGVSVVVLLDPTTQTATVCGNDFWQRMFGSTETLTLPEVLPGFAVEVKKFFE